MSNIGTYPTRALRVFPSEFADIPYPTIITSGTNTSAVSNQLVDSSAEFITNNVKTGDIVYNTSLGYAATVVSVVSETVLILNTDAFSAAPLNYTIYQASSQTGLGNKGCVLFFTVGFDSTATISVQTIGGDYIVSDKIQGGIFPVQVKRVIESDVVVFALW